jgi:outer membrane lipoprotein-sorting protein
MKRRLARLWQARLLPLVAVLCCLADGRASVTKPTPMTPVTVLEKMRAAYTRVEEYQEHMEVKTAQSDGSVVMERFVYSFKKPNHVRLDLETPHSGMVILYPDRNGKVLVKRSADSRFLTLRLRPDSRLLGAHPWHRIDRSDMGLLIENIRHSLTDQRRGPISMSEKDGVIIIRVLATDHFRPAAVTLYDFSIDSAVWLPVGVTESTAEGRLTRETRVDNLRLNPGLPDSFFDADSGYNSR